MEQILDDFKNYMIKNQKSQNTIKNYVLHIKEYMIWFQDTYWKGFKNLYRENILDYKSYLVNVKLEDLSLDAKELIIRKGKGKKQRVVYLNSKIVNAIKEYLKVRNSESEYLFSSRESDRVDRSVINKQFKKYSNKITPHQLRHFFCTNALESGFAVHEVANLAGHSSIQTTLIYTNPSREKMKSRIEML